jgi:hypothetical protein
LRFVFDGMQGGDASVFQSGAEPVGIIAPIGEQCLGCESAWNIDPS